MNQQLRDLAARHGMLPMPDDEAINRYEDAVERYATEGNKTQLFLDLAVLGLDTDTIKWHVANRGARMVTVTAS
jgi:hypothetical protein